MVFLVGNLALGVSAFSFFVCVYCMAKESLSQRILVGNQKGTASCVAGPGFLSFLFLFVTILHVIQILSGPKTFLYISFVFFRSSIGNFSSSFVFF